MVRRAGVCQRCPKLVDCRSAGSALDNSAGPVETNVTKGGGTNVKRACRRKRLEVGTGRADCHSRWDLQSCSRGDSTDPGQGAWSLTERQHARSRSALPRLPRGWGCRDKTSSEPTWPTPASPPARRFSLSRTPDLPFADWSSRRPRGEDRRSGAPRWARRGDRGSGE